MSNDANGNTMPPPEQPGVRQRDREQSGIEPFSRLRYHRRGRSISRVVAVQPGSRGEGSEHVLEIFFGLG